MRILTRYVLRSLVGPFVFALSAITLLMLLNELGKRFGRLLGKGLEAGVIVEVFALSLPFILAMTLPMAVLAAVLYTFNRMASDNEITAMKASGQNLPRLLMPVVAAATVLALGMVWFNNTVLPDSNHRLQVLLSSISQKKPTFVLKERTINEVLDEELYIQVARVDRSTNELADVVIYDQRVPEQSRVIYADSGKMALSGDGTDLYLTLRHGHTQEQEADQPSSLQRMQFATMVMRVPEVSNRLRRREMGGYRGDREMSIRQLRAEADDARGQAAAVEAESRAYAVAMTRRLLGLPNEDPEELEARLMPDRPAPAGPRARAGREADSPSGDEAPADGNPADGNEGGEDAAPGERASLTVSDVSRAADDSAGSGAGTAGRAARGTTERSPPAATPGPAGSADAGTAADPAPVDTALAEARVQGLERALRASSTSAPQASFGSLSRRRSSSMGQANRYEVEIQKKYSIPAACIVFVLIGGPLAVRYRQAGVAMVVAASLLIFCAYYVSLVGGEELADELILSPFWAMWAPNVLFGGVGLALLRQSVKVG